jgi:chaperonin GroES
MKDTIQPVAGRVIVLPDPAPEKTESGLFIPDNAKQPPQSGTVTHVGPDPLYAVGQRVLFVKNAGVELNMEPVHFLMREEDIYATI